MTRDDLIREYRQNSGSWQALVGVYVLIVAAMILTGYMVIG